MMAPSQALGARTVTKAPRVSFEFFPPKNDAMEERLLEAAGRLAPIAPDFVSVTYGAGGSTRERSLSAVRRIMNETGLDVAAHMTCVGASRAEVDAVVDEFIALGVHHFVALRGDPAEGVGARFLPHPDGYENGAALVAGIRAKGDLEVSVAAYPEKHPESPDFATDMEMLKRKVDNGATRAITQFFFENDTYERYVERVRRAGIYIPIVPGILPIHSFAQVAKFAGQCGAHVPDWLVDRFAGLGDDPQTHQLVAAATAAEQVIDLVQRGVDGFHFYSMNRADLSLAVCRVIGLRPGNGDVVRSEAA